MTCRDLITDALGEIKVYGAGETPSIEDINVGLTRLQELSDAYLGNASPVLTLDSPVPGPTGVNTAAFRYELAFQLCGPFGGQFTSTQERARIRARSRMIAAIRTPTDADVEAALLWLDANRFLHGADFSTGEVDL